jgi:hypothetical protein
MDELMNMIVSDESPSNISDKIKDLLFAKSADKVDNVKPTVATNMFSGVSGASSDESTGDSE